MTAFFFDATILIVLVQQQNCNFVLYVAYILIRFLCNIGCWESNISFRLRQNLFFDFDFDSLDSDSATLRSIYVYVLEFC